MEPAGGGHLPAVASDLRIRLEEHLVDAKALGAANPLDQRLVAAILDLGHLTKAEILSALESAAEGQRLVDIIDDEAILSDDALSESLALASLIEYIDLDSTTTFPEHVRKLLPDQLAWRYTMVPAFTQNLEFDAEGSPSGGGTLFVALGDARQQGLAVQALGPVLKAQGVDVTFVAAPVTQVRKILEERYGKDRNKEIVVDYGTDDDDGLVEEDLAASGSDSEARKAFFRILDRAVKTGASDIHFDTLKNGSVRVRLRIDGDLVPDQDLIPNRARVQLANILRQEFGMDVANQFHPQSGRFGGKVDGRSIDLRGEFTPVNDSRGFGFTIRVIDKENVSLFDFEKLGVSPGNLTLLERAYNRPDGAVLVCGPTGSGKSTTLYAILGKVVDDSRQVISIEDPIEYELEGVRQIAVNEKRDVTFSTALRSALRQDPEIIMVGEIRDRDTAETAMTGAQTGHLLLTTIHCNTAAEAPIKLIDMGVPAFTVAEAVSAVVAQRLLKTLCSHCRIKYEPTVEEFRKMGYPYREELQTRAAKAQAEQERAAITAQRSAEDVYKIALERIARNEWDFRQANPSGCTRCRNGWSGRVAVHEILLLNADIKRNILSEQRSSDTINALGRQNGTISMMDDALSRVFHGFTTLEEVRKKVRGDS